MLTALLFALALGLWGIYKGKVKKSQNHWISILALFCLVSAFYAPQPLIVLFDIGVSNFWIWQPLFSILVFYLMFTVISSNDFEQKDLKLFFEIMVWCGFLMGAYAILQYFGVDQFFRNNNNPDNTYNPQWPISGFFGQPTILSPFIAMLIPIALLMRRYGKAIVMIIAVLFTKSTVAITAMCLMLLFIASCNNKKIIGFAVTGVIIIGVLFSMAYCTNNKLRQGILNDNGRFVKWKQIVSDISNPAKEINNRTYGITGFGLGTFKFLYHIKHNNCFFQAHNEYLEILYNLGIVGLALFLMSIFRMVKINLKPLGLNRYRKYLLASFLCIAVCAGGTFVWQLGAHVYYTVFIVGLLHNEGGLV